MARGFIQGNPHIMKLFFSNIFIKILFTLPVGNYILNSLIMLQCMYIVKILQQYFFRNPHSTCQSLYIILDTRNTPYHFVVIIIIIIMAYDRVGNYIIKCVL